MASTDTGGNTAAGWAHQEITRYAKAASKGDRAAFSALFGLRAVPTYVSIACLAGQDAPLDALTIRVFERAWHRLPLLEQPEQFDRWLLDVVTEVTDAEPRPNLDETRGLGRLVGGLATLVPRHREVLLLRNVFRASAASVAQALSLEVDEVHRLEQISLELISEHAQPNQPASLAA
ncbi:MAG: hypothetical protein HOH95_11340 [Dehalococcoidia bacterium]|nr:hypothetical protein [Dehalococcoidia bacterium]